MGARTGTLRLDRPRIMGIVNVTPDSFSDGGRSRNRSMMHVARSINSSPKVRTSSTSARSRHARAQRPSRSMKRCAIDPAVAAAVEAHPGCSGFRGHGEIADCARGACGRGIDRERCLCDATRFRDAEVVARKRRGVVLMHSRGDVAFMASFSYATTATHVVGEVVERASRECRHGVASGIDRSASSSIPGWDSRSARHTRSPSRADSRV
jgi:dihydropteroate synthase